MREMERIGNQIEQIQTAMDGLVERLAKLEGVLNQSKRSSVYIDESTALMSSEYSDIEWVRNKITETEHAL